jgi:hypothetical protein
LNLMSMMMLHYYSLFESDDSNVNENTSLWVLEILDYITHNDVVGYQNHEF